GLELLLELLDLGRGLLELGLGLGVLRLLGAELRLQIVDLAELGLPLLLGGAAAHRDDRREREEPPRGPTTHEHTHASSPARSRPPGGAHPSEKAASPQAE